MAKLWRAAARAWTATKWLRRRAERGRRDRPNRLVAIGAVELRYADSIKYAQNVTWIYLLRLQIK
jgi:hypothetical protein